MRNVVMVVIVLTLASAPALARRGRAQGTWNNLTKLQVGERIEVVDQDQKSFSGTFVAFSQNGIVLHAGKTEQSIERSRVLRVSARDTSRRTRNIILGAAIGTGIALPFAIVGLVINSNEGNGCPACIIGIAAGAGVGAGLGAVPSKRTVYSVRRH